MNQQPNQQSQGQAPGPNRMNFQPGQIQQLAKQCNFEFNEAKKLGLDTQAGQEHLRKAQRIKQILLQYQQQQQRNNSQSVPQNQSSQVQPQSQPQAQAQTQTQTRPAQTSQPQQQQQIQSPQLAQVQQQQLNQRKFNQQSPVTQQQAISQPNSNLNTGATASPSPMAQSIPATATAQAGAAAGSSNPQAAPKTPFQQLQQVKLYLGEFQKKLKAIDDAKKSAALPPESLTRLLQQEQVLKDRYNSYKTVAINISQQLQKQQQQLQQQQQQQQQNFQQQSRSQSTNPIVADGSMGQLQSPSLGQSVVQNQQAQAGNSINLQRNTPSLIPQNQAQSIQNNNINTANNFQTSQQQSPPIQQQQIPVSQAQSIQNQQQRNLSQSQTPQAQQQQIPKSVGGQTLPQNPSQIQAAQNMGLNQQPGSQQARSTLQSRTGTPQPGTSSLPIQGRSASPNTPVTNVNAAAKPNGTNGNVINPAQAANVFKTSVPSIGIPAQINVKPPVPVSINQNRPSLTGGQGISAPALTTPALMKLPPYEMQSDRVLSKRKLSELVKTVGADEGDGETTIDGDVEELLLDLADEFVSNVTAFACRLAKHRKSENLDVKDVQLHLEKNWNIRIPGYSSDEIRSVRKWIPSNAHSQRIQGIGISKSVEQNK